MASTTSWNQVMSPRPTWKRLMSISRMGEGLKVGCKLKNPLFLTQIFVFHWFIFLSRNRGYDKHNFEKIPNILNSSTVLFATQHIIRLLFGSKLKHINWITYRATLKLENIFLCVHQLSWSFEDDCDDFHNIFDLHICKKLRYDSNILSCMTPNSTLERWSKR